MNVSRAVVHAGALGCSAVLIEDVVHQSFRGVVLQGRVVVNVL